MYGLNENVDLKFLHGKRLIQICISLQQVTLRFDEDISISVESAIKMICSNGNVYQYKENTSINKEFLKLLGESIDNVIADKSGTIFLLFESGSKIEIIDDSDKYESYQIIANGKTIIV